MSLKIYACPECGYRSANHGECPACFDSTGELVVFVEQVKQDSKKAEVVNGQRIEFEG
jgi:predicted ATP-dependent serine protease